VPRSQQNNPAGFYHARSFSMGEAITNGNQLNGRGDEDSGHGSSLDRNYSQQQQQYHQFHSSPPHSHQNSPR
jgi:hypothetical protein